MFKFIANIIAAQRNAALLATASKEISTLEAKMRGIVSHATIGATADITRSLNDICVDISRMRSNLWNDAKALGAERKAKELAGDLLHSMHDAERKVLTAFHEEQGRTLADVAAYTGVALNDVRTLAKALVIKGLAYFGRLVDDDGAPAGSGYLLTVKGAELKVRALAADVEASAKAAVKSVEKVL